MVNTLIYKVDSPLKYIPFLTDNMEITIEMLDDEPIIAKLPMNHSYLITETTPPVSGSGHSTKKAVLDIGVEITGYYF
jgi:hypothetical protein